MLTAICQAVGEERAEFRLQQVAKPSLEGLPPGSLLVRIQAASICGSDLFGRNESTGREPISHLNTCCREGYCGGTGHELLGVVEQQVEPGTMTVGQQVPTMAPAYICIQPWLRKAFEDTTQQPASTLKPLSGGLPNSLSRTNRAVCPCPIRLLCWPIAFTFALRSHWGPF